MWHRVDFIAKTQRLPVDELVEFAKRNESKFHIDTAGEMPECSTWNCDALIEAFKEQQGASHEIARP